MRLLNQVRQKRDAAYAEFAKWQQILDVLQKFSTAKVPKPSLIPSARAPELLLAESSNGGHKRPTISKAERARRSRQMSERRKDPKFEARRVKALQKAQRAKRAAEAVVGV